MASSFDDFSGGFDDGQIPPESPQPDDFFGSMADDQPYFGPVFTDPHRFLYVGLSFYEKMAKFRK